MSDDGEYSDNINSDSDNESTDDVIINKKPILKINPTLLNPSSTLLKKKIYEENDDSDVDGVELEDDDDDDDEKEFIGGSKDTPGGDESDADESDVDESDADESAAEDEDEEGINKDAIEKPKQNKKQLKVNQLIIEDEEDDDDEDEYDENYLQKFDNDIIKNYVNEFHPECLSHNYDEIAKLSVVVRNEDGIIIDPIHRTIPYLTKYERARILGQRAKQIETGAKPLVRVPENIIDSYIIAELELKEKKIPFIIRRPIPGGACEYWNIRDLEVISF